MSGAEDAHADTDALTVQDDDRISLPSDPVVNLLSALLLIAVLIVANLAAEIVLPIVSAIVLKLLLEPGMRFLKRFKLPRPVSALVLIVLVFGLIAAIGAAVSGPAIAWASKLPEGVMRLQQRLSFLSQPIETVRSFLHSVDGMVGGAESGGVGFGSAMATSVFMGTTHFTTSFFEMLLILFFLLVSGGVFLNRTVEILPTFRDKRQAVELSLDIENKISGYLITISVMNALVGAAVGVAMWLVGLNDPLLWAVVAFVLNYIPIIGPLMGVIVFLLVGLLEIPSLVQALLPAAIYFGIHIVEGEIVTPSLLAKRFTLNPVLVIIALIFWFWMWGVAGAILSVPMLAITKILCDGIRPLRAVGHFLGGED